MSLQDPGRIPGYSYQKSWKDLGKKSRASIAGNKHKSAFTGFGSWSKTTQRSLKENCGLVFEKHTKLYRWLGYPVRFFDSFGLGYTNPG